MTRSEVNNAQNNPNIYEIESRGGNVSHAFEQNHQTLRPSWYFLPWNSEHTNGEQEESQE